MPNRVLRDELLTSERWWSVSADARTLWLSVFLSADDLGRAPGNPFTCRTKYLAGTIANPERVEKILCELQDIDLLRVYEHDGARYFFVPRFRQFVRYTRSKYPKPPKGISDIDLEKQRASTTEATPKRPEVKRSEVKRSERKGVVGESTSPTRGDAGQDLLKDSPSTPDLERGRRMGEALLRGDIEAARKLRDEK